MEDIVKGVARCLWATAWAKWMEDAGRGRELSGNDITAIMPEVPACVESMARRLTEKTFGMNAEVCYQTFKSNIPEVCYEDRDLSPETFGHYMTMEAMGEGVGLWQWYAHGLAIPDIEGPMLLKGLGTRRDGSLRPKRNPMPDLKWTRLSENDFLVSGF